MSLVPGGLQIMQERARRLPRLPCAAVHRPWLPCPDCIRGGSLSYFCASRLPAHEAEDRLASQGSGGSARQAQATQRSAILVRTQRSLACETRRNRSIFRGRERHHVCANGTSSDRCCDAHALRMGLSHTTRLLPSSHLSSSTLATTLVSLEESAFLCCYLS